MSIFAMSKVRDFFREAGHVEKKRFSKAETAAFDVHGWRCFYCASPRCLTADHITPRAIGGDDEASNLVPACRTCNSSRGKKDFDEFLEEIAAQKIAFETMMMGAE